MMMLVMLMKCSQKLKTGTCETTVSRKRACKTVAMYNSGLVRIKRNLTQALTTSCITLVLVWLGGFHIGVLGDSALSVDIIVVLIKTLGLTELVSDALASRKQKEAG